MLPNRRRHWHFLTERVCLENGREIYFHYLERPNTLHSWSYKYDFISIPSGILIEFQTPVIINISIFLKDLLCHQIN